jgi:hypothetical protein
MDDNSTFALPAFFQDDSASAAAGASSSSPASGLRTLSDVGRRDKPETIWPPSDAPLFDGLEATTSSLLDDTGDDAPWDKWGMGLPTPALASDGGSESGGAGTVAGGARAASSLHVNAAGRCGAG